MSACRRIQTCPYLSHCTNEIQANQRENYKDTKPDTLYLIEEKVGDILEQIGLGDNFLNRTPIMKFNKWNLMKLKSICKAKDTVNRTKVQSTE